MLDYVRARDNLNRVEKFTDRERLQSFAFELISPRLQIESGEEANTAVRDFTASIASAYRLTTGTLTLRN
jgi:hypothetical protein